MKFAFVDGEKIAVCEDGNVQKFDSKYVVNYRETAIKSAKSREWKTQGKASRLMDEDYYFERENGANAEVFIRGVALTEKENELVYAASVNDSSVIYKKDLLDEEKTESHVVSSNSEEFMSVSRNRNGGMLAAIQRDPVAADIAVFEQDGGDYKCVTGGDSLDENPAFDTDGKSVLFNSYGVGRDANNNFIKYLPSELFRLDLSTLNVDTVASDRNFSYIKPLPDGEGNLYCIKKPDSEKTERNPLLQILLIPVRIVQGIAGFISAFVMCFSGKPLVDGQSAQSLGGDATKNGKYDRKKVFINNNLLNVDEQLKKNKKQENYGFIPQSWKLIKIDKDGNETELTGGVADFCFTDDGNGKRAVIFTNGKHIFTLTDEGKRKKLADADFCLKVGGTPSPADESNDLFGLI